MKPGARGAPGGMYSVSNLLAGFIARLRYEARFLCDVPYCAAFHITDLSRRFRQSVSLQPMRLLFHGTGSMPVPAQFADQ